MNIAYLIWTENLNSPIIRGQTIEILKELSNVLKKDKIYLIFFQAIYPFNRKLNLNSLKKELKAKGIHLIVIPVIYSEWWFSAKSYQLPFIFIQTFPVLFYLVVAKNIKLLHCRSYPITLAAIAIKKLKNIKIIFDPRSDFPEENVTAGKWGINSLSFKIWKLLEKMYLRNSDKTIAIAKTYIGHFEKICKDAKFSLVPNNVDTEKFKRNKEFRQHFRSRHNMGEKDILFCYCGTLGDHWHNPETYASYIIKFRALNLCHRFLFITPNIEILKNVFNQHRIKPEEYIVVHSKFEDVPKYLSAGDFGMVVMGQPKITMAIKTAEYLAMGLPVITNSNLAGAKEIVEENSVGVVHDIDSNLAKLQQFIEEFIQNRERISVTCRQLAERMFSNEIITARCAKIYQGLK